MNPNEVQPASQPSPQPAPYQPPTDPPAPVVAQAAQPQPVQPVQPSPAYNPYPQQPLQQASTPPPENPSSAGTIILQWLTYAFWGWTVLALSILTTTIVANFIDDADTSGFTPYGIAAVLVLLPISYVCDHFYSKKEPAKKTGSVGLVMIIHAVLFALFAIGSLITAVVSLVLMFTSSTGSKGAQVALLSALIITVFYVLTFLRTLNPSIVGWIQNYYKMIMLVSVGIIALLGIVGPVAQERSTRDDKLITSSLSDVQSSISNYSRSNNKLPTDLKTLNLNGDAKQLVDRGLVEYKPQSGSSYTTPTSRFDTRKATPVYKYELCVNFKKESRNYGSNNRYDYDSDGDDYDSYISAYDHPAGAVCYKLKTTDY